MEWFKTVSISVGVSILVFLILTNIQNNIYDTSTVPNYHYDEFDEFKNEMPSEPIIYKNGEAYKMVALNDVNKLVYFATSPDGVVWTQIKETTNKDLNE